MNMSPKIRHIYHISSAQYYQLLDKGPWYNLDNLKAMIEDNKKNLGM